MYIVATNVKQRFAEWFEQAYLTWQAERGKRASLNEFADYIGYSRSLISFWLAGQRLPAEDGVKRLAELFGLEIYDVLELPRPNPFLESLTLRWENIPPEKQRKLAEDAERYEVKNADTETAPKRRKAASDN